jgi:hypothetical protein
MIFWELNPEVLRWLWLMIFETCDGGGVFYVGGGRRMEMRRKGRKGKAMEDL